MNQSELQTLLREGIAAAKAGRTEQARQALLQVVELDETNVSAWLWLSAVVEDPVDKFTCLENVLALEPENKHARLGLARLQQQSDGVAPTVRPSPLATTSSPFPATETSPAPSSSTPVSSPLPPSSASSPEKSAGEEVSSPGQAGSQPASSPKQQTPVKRPGHLKEHASMAGVMLQDNLAARRPLPVPEKPFVPVSSAEQAQLEANVAAEVEPPVKDTWLSTRRIILRVVVLLASLVLCAPCSLLGGCGVVNELALRYRGEVVEAYVTDSYTYRGSTGVVYYMVQYEFSFDGQTWHSFGGDPADDAYWCPVSSTAYETATNTKKIKVLYLPNKPQVNRPLRLDDRIDLLAIMGTILGVGVVMWAFFLGGGWALSLFIFRPTRKKPTLPARSAIRYKRLAPQPARPEAPAPKAKYLQEHASMAGALIRSKSTARGEDVLEFEPATSEAEAPPEKGSVLCPFCRRPISAMSTRCHHCRLPLVVDCPACGARLDVELAECPECGYTPGNFRHKTIYFSGLAAAYQEHEKYGQAVTAWQIVNMLNPDYPEIQLRLAEAQAGAGRSNVAINTLRQVLAEDPGQIAAALVLGKIYHQLSYWDEAEDVYQEALVETPESAELNFSLGWLLMDHGQLKKSFDYFQKATRLDPRHGMVWFRLGQLYEASRRPKLAVEAYRRAATLLPADTLAQKKAQRLAGVLAPDLPDVLATGWFELLRQLTGPALLCFLAAVLDAGMRPWWIPGTGWLALGLGLLGAFLWTSGASLPYNPAIRFIAGERGLTSAEARFSVAIFGAIFWLVAMGIILYPIGQSSPEVPEWILKLSTT